MKTGDRYPSNAKATPSEEKPKKSLTIYTEACIIITASSRGARRSKSTKYAESRSRTYTISELKNLGWNVNHPSQFSSLNYYYK